MRHQVLLMCLAGALWLVSFGFAEPVEQVPEKVPDKVDQLKKAPAAKAEAGEVKVLPSVKSAPKAVTKKVVAAKAVKKESKTPIADLLNAAVDKLFGNAVDQPAQVRQGVVVMRAQQAGAMAKQLEQQYAPRLRQVYRSELHFMRMVCQPTRQQFEKIAAAGELELQTSIKKFVAVVVEQQQGRAQNQVTDPRKLITSGIAHGVRDHLSAEQAAQYQKEVDERGAARKRMVILSLLAAMDRKLMLTAEQRDKLNTILEKSWNDSWNQLQVLMQGGQYFPVMPDDKILPILTDTQKTAWRDVQKGTIFFGGSDLDAFEGIDVGEEVWNEPGKKK